MYSDTLPRYVFKFIGNDLGYIDVTLKNWHVELRFYFSQKVAFKTKLAFSKSWHPSERLFHTHMQTS